MERESSFSRRLRSAAERVFRNRPVLAAYAFGSRVSGAARPDSDLDVGYYHGDYPQAARLSVREEMQLAIELADILKVEVDLHDLGATTLEFRGRVLEDGIRIYSSDEVRRVTLERELLARYHDYKFELQQLHETRLRAIATRGL